MSITIELTPAEEARIAALASSKGLPLDAFIRAVVLSYNPQEESADPTLALFAQWAEDDKELSTAELEKDQQIYAEIEKNGIPRTKI